jgi:hypothetical protein
VGVPSDLLPRDCHGPKSLKCQRGLTPDLLCDQVWEPISQSGLVSCGRNTPCYAGMERSDTNTSAASMHASGDVAACISKRFAVGQSSPKKQVACVESK